MRGLPASRLGTFLSASLFNQTSKKILRRLGEKSHARVLLLEVCILAIFAFIAAPHASAAFNNSQLDFGSVMINTTKCDPSFTWENISPGNTYSTVCDSHGCQTGYKYAEVTRSASFSYTSTYPGTNPAAVTVTPTGAANVPAFGTVSLTNICATPPVAGDSNGFLVANVSPAFSGGGATSESISVHVKGIQSLLQAEPLGGSLNFGTVYLTQSSSTSFSVYNYASSPITITNVATGNGYFTVTSGINQTVPANGASPATVTIKFAPTTLGNFSGTVQVTTTGGNLTYPYSGTGANFPRPSITTSETGNGIITPSTTIDYNGSITITMTPSPGNTLNTLYDNGQNVSNLAHVDPSNQSFWYSLSNVTQNHSISATFVTGEFPQQTAQVPTLPPVAGLILATGISGYMFWSKRKRSRSA